MCYLGILFIFHEKLDPTRVLTNYLRGVIALKYIQNSSNSINFFIRVVSLYVFEVHGAGK